MKTIITIQHTQSIHHTNGMVGSWTDWDLSELGVQQAWKIGEKLKKELAGKKFKMYSSDLKRAYMTAQIINKKFNKNIETDKRLREFSFGTLEGITREKITPEIWDDFNKNPKKFNAEKREEIFKRIKSFINDIKSNDKNILVVTHGGPIRMIKYYLENGESFNDKKYLAEYMTLKINNLDLFIIDEEMNLIKKNL